METKNLTDTLNERMNTEMELAYHETVKQICHERKTDFSAITLKCTHCKEPFKTDDKVVQLLIGSCMVPPFEYNEGTLFLEITADFHLNCLFQIDMSELIKEIK